MPIDTESLLDKVANSELRLSPHVIDVVRRIKTAGLHRTAAALRGASSPITIKTAASTLGVMLITAARRREKIAAGLAALSALDDNG